MKITGEYIKLDSFLKLVNEAGSGGEAKNLICDGLVTVNDEPETRRGRKLRHGDRITINGKSFLVEQEVV